ncbi:MAG: helix-turn-helix transcriptional regulator [Atopobiaceae bacterium]|nr:helix-turn-helix transcriptional regulator [Atopobiaceae bacterium]
MNRGEILRRKRKEKGYTQAEAAKGIGGVVLRSYNSYENGKEPRDKMFWARAAKFFDCDVEEFGVSISEDDAYDSYYQADRQARTKKLAALTTGSTLASLALGGPPLAAVSFSLTMASYAAGVYMGRRKAMKEALPEDDEALRKMLEKRERFIRKALSYLCMALTDLEINPKRVRELPDDGPDVILEVDTETIKSWWLCFEEGVVDKGDRETNFVNEIRARAALARFWNFAPSPERKASIVVEDESLYEMLTAQNGGAYRGNLSAILVDTEDARIISEEFLATYEEGADEGTLMRIVD